MQTRVIRWSKSEGYDIMELREAARIIRYGGLVAFPTETVYGLGCDGRKSEAAAKVYEAKGRPSDNPLILHIADREMLDGLVGEIPEVAEKLIETFWPGPMTLVFTKSDAVPDEVTGGLKTVAVRMPAHAGAAELIREAGVPIAAPSANLSGKPSPTDAKHVIEDLDGRIDMIIDGGEVGIGYESTIIDVTGLRPAILRPGFITKEMIEEVIGNGGEVDAVIDSSDSAANEAPRAPGMKYKHYSPDADVTVVRGEEAQVEEKIKELTRQFPAEEVGVLTTDERKYIYDRGYVLSIGSEREHTLGQTLYASLREFDHLGVKKVYAETFFGNDKEDALMNRLMKAAGGQVVDLRNYDKVIFVCKENLNLSPMCEWILKSIITNKSFEICSRGLVVLFEEPINAKIISVLGKHCVPCEEQVSKQLKQSDIDEHTLIITMSFTEKVKVIEDYGVSDHVFTLRELVGLEDDVNDPYGGEEQAYEETYSELKDLLFEVKKRMGWV
ncbi:MAG: threonylcarbamoyl-AMP synthase [Eubacterium sp.]|nr:threonylcarbamoyl-AMP synthase [Eubacterium sp.]